MKKIKKNYLLGFVSTVLLSVTLVGCSEEEVTLEGKKEKVIENTQTVVEEPKTETQEENNEPVQGRLSWEAKIKEIALSAKTETEKHDDVVFFAREFTPSEEELKIFEDYILEEYKSKRYLSDITNHEYMVKNMFISSVVELQHPDHLDEPINQFAFNFYQNTKYTYRGVDTPTSPDTLKNEEKMNRAIQYIK